jgi:hypothetical protein
MRAMRKTVLPAVVVLIAAALAITGGFVLRAEAAGSTAASVVHTGYGDVHVERAEAIRGLDPHDLGGAAHGVAGLVQRDQMLVQVTLLVTGNGSDKPVDAGKFRLRAGGNPVAPATSSLAGGTLPAGANVEGTLGFVAAIKAARLVLSVPNGDRSGDGTDGTATDVVIPAEAVDGTPTGGDISIDPNGAASGAPDGGLTVDPDGGVSLAPGTGEHHHDSTGSTVTGPSDQNSPTDQSSKQAEPK